ncbi:MAG: c-type cytochrome [Burkholderiaceae bacterium]|jgi:cytochrome c5|tara:strand:- start:1229 stop:1735 length:507 start_codon:yes stop_codon:yes gene_type:complete
MSDSPHEHHTGPVKTPAQLGWLSFYFFVAPVFIIIGLVYYVTSGAMPSAGADNTESAIVKRIQRVGSIEIRDANRPLRAGMEVYTAQCAACHTAGAAGAPVFGNIGAWSTRLDQGYELLLKHALEGKGAMGAQGGGEYNDLEIGRAVVYMSNEVGAAFVVPEKPADSQ